MRLNVDGRRLTDKQVADLLDMLGWLDLAAVLLGQGYHLCRVRAPRSAPADGRLTVRLAWKRRIDGAEQTVRLAGTVDVTPV